MTAAAVAELVDRVHRALRAVDSTDLTAPLRRREIDLISDAVEEVETFARNHGIKLSEFAR